MTMVVWLLIAAAVLWLAVTSVGLATISDLKSFPGGFRRFLTIASLALIVGAVAWLGWGKLADRRRLLDEELASNQITKEQIEFRSLRMGVGGPLVLLQGRVSNNNPIYTLTQVEMRLRVLECDASFRCDTLGDQTESIAVSVPPQQSREISHDVFFSGLGAARLRRSWSHELISVTGR